MAETEVQERKRKRRTLSSGWGRQSYCHPIGQSKSRGQAQRRVRSHADTGDIVKAVSLPPSCYYLNFSTNLKSFQIKSERNVLGFSRETDLTEYVRIERNFFYEELAHTILEAELSQGLQIGSWSCRRADGVAPAPRPQVRDPGRANVSVRIRRQETPNDSTQSGQAGEVSTSSLESQCFCFHLGLRLIR